LLNSLKHQDTTQTRQRSTKSRCHNSQNHKRRWLSFTYPVCKMSNCYQKGISVKIHTLDRKLWWICLVRTELRALIFQLHQVVNSLIEPHNSRWLLLTKRANGIYKRYLANQKSEWRKKKEFRWNLQSYLHPFPTLQCASIYPLLLPALSSFYYSQLLETVY
jgi:hypothetical protein